MEKADIESIPIKKTFDLKDEKDAYDAAEEMVEIGFYKEKKGFKVLMPKEPKKNSAANWVYSHHKRNVQFKEG